MKEQLTELKGAYTRLKDEWEALKETWFDVPDFSNLYDTARDELSLLNKEMEHYIHQFQVGYRTEEDRMDSILTMKKQMAGWQHQINNLSAKSGSKAEEAKTHAELEYEILKQQVEKEEQMLEYANQQKALQVEITHERMKQLELEEELGDRTKTTLSAQLDESFNILQTSIKQGLGSEEINQNLTDFANKLREAWLEGTITETEMNEYQNRLTQMNIANQDHINALSEQYSGFKKERNVALTGAWISAASMGIDKEKFENDLVSLKNWSLTELEELAANAREEIEKGGESGENVFGYQINEGTASYYELLAQAELAKRELEGVNNKIKDTEEKLFDTSLAAELFGMTMDEQLKGQITAFDRQLEILESERAILEQQGKDTSEKDKEILNTRRKQLELVNQLIKYMKDNNFLESDIHEWEMRRFSVNEQITNEIEKQNDAMSEQDAKLKRLILQQQKLLKAQADGTDVSAQLARNKEAQFARMLELGYDPLQIEKYMNAIPRFGTGGITDGVSIAGENGQEAVFNPSTTQLLKSMFGSNLQSMTKNPASLVSALSDGGDNYNNQISIGISVNGYSNPANAGKEIANQIQSFFSQRGIRINDLAN